MGSGPVVGEIVAMRDPTLADWLHAIAFVVGLCILFAYLWWAYGGLS